MGDWGPAIVWTAVLFFASSRPTLPVDLAYNTDKLAHFGAYAVLGVLLARGQHRARVAVNWALFLGILIGGADEVFQGFIPGRSPELLDWLADSLGIVAGVFTYHAWRNLRDERRTRSRRISAEPVAHE